MKRAQSAIEQSGALVESLELEPYDSGPLDGLTFTVKDNIDIAGRKTSYGSPAWRDRHPPAFRNALCVEQVLAAGAACVGKAIADEFTYSLDGENPFFGTPLNPRTPDRVPGGSSSGSASSVACGLADFSLGTDAGGSVRVPASLCGVWGIRPSLHRISEAGVLPFMPSVSTVGVLARSHGILERTTRVLLRSGPRAPAEVKRIFVLNDAFRLATPEIAAAAREALDSIASRSGVTLETVDFADIVGREMDLVACNKDALRNVQTAEFQNTVGNWIENQKPELGFAFSMAYKSVRAFERTSAIESLELCERLFESIRAFLEPGSVIGFPTTPRIAPLKGTLTSLEAVADFYDPTMAVTSFSGVGRLPEITAPLLAVADCRAGLSFVAGPYQDEFLMTAVGRLLDA
ncbi:MAG: glutamyl-tRNA amidotransferase [Hyphomicrobiales bacterium]|nr:MAG: glutamyl-tRNA amidotransferase [Hyphomicrobiales bacterium]